MRFNRPGEDCAAGECDPQVLAGPTTGVNPTETSVIDQGKLVKYIAVIIEASCRIPNAVGVSHGHPPLLICKQLAPIGSRFTSTCRIPLRTWTIELSGLVREKRSVIQNLGVRCSVCRDH